MKVAFNLGKTDALGFSEELIGHRRCALRCCGTAASLRVSSQHVPCGVLPSDGQSAAIIAPQEFAWLHLAEWELRRHRNHISRRQRHVERCAEEVAGCGCQQGRFSQLDERTGYRSTFGGESRALVTPSSWTEFGMSWPRASATPVSVSVSLFVDYEQCDGQSDNVLAGLCCGGVMSVGVSPVFGCSSFGSKDTWTTLLLQRGACRGSGHGLLEPCCCSG